MQNVPESLTDVERAAVERALRILAEEIDEASIGPAFVERIADLRGHDLDAHALAEHAVNAFTMPVALAILARALRTIVGTCAAEERARALMALGVADGLLSGCVPPDTDEIGDALSKLEERTVGSGGATHHVGGACTAALAIANAALAARGWSVAWCTVAHATRIARYVTHELGDRSDLLAGMFVASLRDEIEREHVARDRASDHEADMRIAAMRRTSPATLRTKSKARRQKLSGEARAGG